MIKNYLYLKNVEVSRSINFNFNRQSTDKLPTDYQQSADVLPTVGRLLTDRLLKPWKKTVGPLLANSRPTVGQQSADSGPTVGRLSADCGPTVGRLLANCRPTVGGGELFFTITNVSIKNNLTWGANNKHCIVALLNQQKLYNNVEMLHFEVRAILGGVFCHNSYSCKSVIISQHDEAAIDAFHC